MLAEKGAVMTDAQEAVFAVMLGTLVALCLIVIVGIPAVTRLMLRLRLEAIRVDCVDAVLCGRLRNLQSVQRFIADTESSAARPRSLSLPRVFAAYVAMTSLGIDAREMDLPQRRAELDDAESKFMDGLEERLCDAYRSHLKWGTPMSWLLRPVISLLGSDHPNIASVPAEGPLPAVAREAFQSTDRHASAKSLMRHMYAGR
jgi:hypothetical protein